MDIIGDRPVEEKHKQVMINIAHALDGAFNGGDEYTTGFILMVFPLEGHEGRCNYVSNANRKDIVVMLKEQIARFEGQPEVTGNA